jgi:hypothetical protein
MLRSTKQWSYAFDPVPDIAGSLEVILVGDGIGPFEGASAEKGICFVPHHHKRFAFVIFHNPSSSKAMMRVAPS